MLPVPFIWYDRNLIAIFMVGERYKLWSSLVAKYSQSSVTSRLLGPRILLRNCTSFEVGEGKFHSPVKRATELKPAWLGSPQKRPWKPRGRVEVWLYSFFNLGSRWCWVVSATPWPHYPGERPDTHSIGGWVGPRTGLDGCGKSRSPPGFDLRNMQPVASRYTGWAIPAHT
jgi:hypothetical protein